MKKLTRYDSYGALKASKSRNNTDEHNRAERNAALEHFVEQLTDSLKEKEQTLKPDNANELDISKTAL